MKKNNDEKIRIMKMRKLLLNLIIVFGVLTIVLAICSLVFKISPIYAIVCFVIEVSLGKYRNKLEYN